MNDHDNSIQTSSGSPPSSPQELTREQFQNELRKDTGPDFDFDRMESALMARVSVESSRRKLRARVSMGVGALAMAAAAAFIIGRSHGVQPVDATVVTATVADPGAGELESGSPVSVVSSGSKNHVLGRGETLHRGDQVDTARAIFRASGRVVFAVSGAPERGETAQMTVTETDRPIVLSLSRGIVEAQVDKVPSGEAFAVDVVEETGNENNSVRIAVHGTHLRVARANGHVTLDLTEGIVNVGRPPRSGSTYGKLVTAPAHVEFDVASLETSFTMTKDADKVRIAEDLSPALGAGTSGSLDPLALAPEAQKVAPLLQPSPASAKPTQGLAQVQVAGGQPGQNAPKDPGVVPAPMEPRVDARTAINDAIATCALAKLRNAPGELTVTLASTLSLRVGADGYVQAARFEPPLDPAVQKCAAGTIYKVHFDEPANQTTVMMPISLKTPSP
jgi:ferric-dicitrate binding protein FerR (iron transport regulator)